VLATAVATALAIAGRTRGPAWLHVIGKPGILPPLLAATLWLPSILPTNARVFLTAALVLAWLGDVALMFRRGFTLGLLSFLLAHVFYLLCFGVESPWRWQQLAWLAAVIPLLFLGLRGVLPRVGRLKFAVVIYASTLTLVAWRLLARVDRLEQIGTRSFALGLAGGLLFVLADSLLVRRRFAEAKIPYWLELGSYAASQVCIVGATFS
jgi:alkylglycerol monooxygenase